MCINLGDHIERRPLEGQHQTIVAFAASYARSAAGSGDGLYQQHAANAFCAAADGLRIPEGPAFRFGDDATPGSAIRKPGDALLAVVRSGRSAFDRIYIRDRSRVTRSNDMRALYWLEYEVHSYGVEVRYTTDDARSESMNRRVLELWLRAIQFPRRVSTPSESRDPS